MNTNVFATILDLTPIFYLDLTPIFLLGGKVHLVVLDRKAFLRQQLAQDDAAKFVLVRHP